MTPTRCSASWPSGSVASSRGSATTPMSFPSCASRTHVARRRIRLRMPPKPRCDRGRQKEVVRDRRHALGVTPCGLQLGELAFERAALGVLVDRHLEAQALLVAESEDALLARAAGGGERQEALGSPEPFELRDRL